MAGPCDKFKAGSAEWRACVAHESEREALANVAKEKDKPRSAPSGLIAPPPRITGATPPSSPRSDRDEDEILRNLSPLMRKRLQGLKRP